MWYHVKCLGHDTSVRQHYKTEHWAPCLNQTPSWYDWKIVESDVKPEYTHTHTTNGMCTQQRLRSSWASSQSDQSLLCIHWVAKDPSFLHMDREDSDQTGQMPRLIWVSARCICHFVGFVMRRLKWEQHLPLREWLQKGSRLKMTENNRAISWQNLFIIKPRHKKTCLLGFNKVSQSGLLSHRS